MYPPLGMVPRVCIQEYAVPNSKVILRPGDSVILSIHGFQRDEEYHPNPDVFDPDRFSTENRSTTEFAYFPFGHGVRMCIGEAQWFRKWVGFVMQTYAGKVSEHF